MSLKYAVQKVSANHYVLPRVGNMKMEAREERHTRSVCTFAPARKGEEIALLGVGR